MKQKRKSGETTDEMEQAELATLAPELAANDKSEEKAWGIKTDKAAYSRQRIDIPDRW
ncbi:MAG: hypothetical protein AAB229_09525 [Candidatus Hydrogenedentota bacterium]